VVLDVQLVCIVLSICADSKELKLGKEIHQAVVKHGLQFKSTKNELVLSSALVNMYAKSGSLEDAKKIS
jgi:hypothetical protein